VLPSPTPVRLHTYYTAMPGGSRSQRVAAGSLGEEMPASAGNYGSQLAVAVEPVPACHGGGRGFESRRSGQRRGRTRPRGHRPRSRRARDRSGHGQGAPRRCPRGPRSAPSTHSTSSRSSSTKQCARNRAPLEAIRRTKAAPVPPVPPFASWKTVARTLARTGLSLQCAFCCSSLQPRFA
jgi:hypothetical protein